MFLIDLFFSVFFQIETGDIGELATVWSLAARLGGLIGAVAITANTRAQKSLMRTCASRLGHADLPLGGRSPEADKHAVRGFHCIR